MDYKNKFKYGICDIKFNYDYYFNYLLSKLNSIFIWKNLPTNINKDFLNSTLFLDGIIVFFKQDNKLYAMDCAYGGELNEYYIPQEVIIANPILGSLQLTQDKDCVVMYNDSTNIYNQTGLRPLIQQYATLLADNIVSLNCCQINTRVQTVFTADSDAQKNTAEKIFKDLYSGKPYKVVTQDMMEKIGVNPVATTTKTDIISLMEFNNYILSNFYKAVGIMSNSVMKKERLITDEIDSQREAVDFNIYDMLEHRVKAVEKINEMFGTNITVEINPVIMTSLQQDVESPEEALEVKEEVKEENVSDI